MRENYPGYICHTHQTAGFYGECKKCQVRAEPYLKETIVTHPYRLIENAAGSFSVQQQEPTGRFFSFCTFRTEAEAKAAFDEYVQLHLETEKLNQVKRVIE